MVEDNYDYIFHIWATQKYKEVVEFIKKLCVCDKDVIQPDDIITQGSFVQEAMRGYRNIVDSEWWEPIDSNKNYKYEPLLLKASTVSIEAPINNIVEKARFKISYNGKYNNSRAGLYTKSVVTCHKCGKKLLMKNNCKFDRNGSDG